MVVPRRRGRTPSQLIYYVIKLRDHAITWHSITSHAFQYYITNRLAADRTPTTVDSASARPKSAHAPSTRTRASARDLWAGCGVWVYSAMRCDAMRCKATPKTTAPHRAAVQHSAIHAIQVQYAASHRSTARCDTRNEITRPPSRVLPGRAQAREHSITAVGVVSHQLRRHPRKLPLGHCHWGVGSKP